MHLDVAVVFDDDNAALAELCELPTYRFNCQTKKVADFGPRQRQFELNWPLEMRTFRIDVACHIIEKASDLFCSGLAAKCEHPVARFIEFFQCLLVKPVLDRWAALDLP